MSNEDKFELLATIKMLERQRTILVFAYLAAIVCMALFWPSDLERDGQIVSSVILVVGGCIHREVVEARLDAVRSSLRNVLIARDPSILNDPDY